jgi:hypothetical protein
MACFLVSAAEAVVTEVAVKAAEKKEQKDGVSKDTVGHTTFSKKLSWLRNMLLGGSVLLMFEHIWHGEVVPWFPFLTAMADPGDAAEMFHEMGTVGVTMAVIISLVWVGMLLVSNALEKKGVEDVKGVKS